MCSLGEGLRAGQMPAVLYADGTEASKQIEDMLEAAQVAYDIEDATKASLSEPVLVVDGTFLNAERVREVLSL